MSLFPTHYCFSLYAKETSVFYVSTTSYFRFYTEPHHIDIDLKLEENSTVVTQAISFNMEEVKLNNNSHVTSVLTSNIDIGLGLKAKHQVYSHHHLLQVVLR